MLSVKQCIYFLTSITHDKLNTLTGNVNVKAYNAVSIWGYLCALCIITGWLLLFGFEAAFLLDPAAREQLIMQRPALLIAWHLFDWIIFAFSVTLFSFAITARVNDHFRWSEIVINLCCILFASYCISVGLVEILAVLTTTGTAAENSLFTLQALLRILQELRRSTEFSGEIWLILLNLWLLRHRAVNPITIVLGVLTGLLGILLLSSSFYLLAKYYVLMHFCWFFAIATQMLKPSASRKSQST